MNQPAEWVIRYWGSSVSVVLPVIIIWLRAASPIIRVVVIRIISGTPLAGWNPILVAVGIKILGKYIGIGTDFDWWR